MSVKKALFIICFFLNSFGICQQYPGTNLRGQVLAPIYGQWVPLGNARVDIYAFNPAVQQWQLLGTSFTDVNGFYFFRAVPIGNYVLQVNQQKNYNIEVIFIDYNFYAYQDIPFLYF